VVAVFSMTKLAIGAVDSTSVEPKQMSMGLARKSAILARKMTTCDEVIELHKEP
jgi:hypothetical protein